MHRKFRDRQTVFLQPGQWHLARNGEVVRTILGSCVAVTLYDPSLRAGAVCHAVLPASPRRGEEQGCGYYVSCIVNQMVEEMSAIGARPGGVEAKIFGGAGMIGGRSPALSVGRQNLETARRLLKEMGLDLKGHAVGGGAGRVLLFDSATGDAFVRRLGERERPAAP